MSSADGVDSKKFRMFLQAVPFIAVVKVTFALRIREMRVWLPQLLSCSSVLVLQEWCRPSCVLCVTKGTLCSELTSWAKTLDGFAE